MRKKITQKIFFCLVFICICSTLKAQTIDVQGIVKDETGAPLIGASVVVASNKDTQKQTTKTNNDGKFFISGLKAQVSYQISVFYVGYKTWTNNDFVVSKSGQSMLNIQLLPNSDLDEVVVMGYGTQKKGAITGAVASVKMDKLTDMPVSRLSNALAGRVAGVNITNTSGLAGASSSIRVRGSFNNPLYVIDGVIKNKEAFDALDANEIDQMTMLKDAASASVYGSQAGNGVLVITTKKGTEQKPVFSFQVSNSISNPTQQLLSDKTRASDDLIYQNRVAQFDYEQNPNRPAVFTPPNAQREFDYFKDKNYNANDMIWRNPTNQKYLLSVNGGSDKITYFAMAGYTKEKGSYINLDYNKFNLRSNITAKISKAISVNLNLAAAQQNDDRFYWAFDNLADDFNIASFYRVTFNWPKLFPFYTEKDGTPANYITPYPVQTPMGSWTAWGVIDQVIGDRYQDTRRRQFNPTLTMDVKLDQFTKGLSTKVLANYEANDYMRKTYLSFQKNYVYIPADPSGNRFIPAAPDPNQTSIFNFGVDQPSLNYNLATGWKYQLDWFLNYDRTFGKHGVNAMIVYEQAEAGSISSTATGYSPLTESDQMFAYPTAAGKRIGGASEGNGANQSWIGRLNYNFDERYIADFSFRYDGNPLFAANKRWGFFPSVSLAWRLSRESFLKNAESWLNDLKLRGSYGTTGNPIDVNGNAIAGFTYDYTYGNSGSYMFGNTLYQGIGPGATPNPNVTWATIQNTNIGLDFAFLNNRLSGSVDAYVNKMKDILGYRTVTLPASYGQSLAPENYAARSFRGIDLDLKWQDRAGEVSYSVYGNMAYTKDRWDIIDQSADYLPGGVNNWRSAIGQPNNRIIGFKSLGIVRTQSELDALKAKGFKQYGRTPYLGAIIYEDIRGDAFSPGPDGKIDDNDLQLLSNNASPRINFGLGFNVEWKGFSIDALLQGVGAYDRMISNYEGGGMRQWGGNFRTYYPIWADDVWTPENPNGKYPRVNGQNWAESGTGASTFWMRSGAYLRVRNINVAYNLPQKWIKKIGLSGTQVFFNGSNLLTFSKMKEFQDPEQDNYDSYPIMKTFTMGLNVKF
ncbi:TonB-dependent receptor [Pedobacter nyackensis]|uniref:SusC/RagA family TonB-linked outer membrane protein n=1 Tax=Pedobacter nyackensis TaxID=475255 RepID=UPI00292F7BD9|nr:TonB-dependent receptor [Pedobacter nyackensis]